jgi:hypothetical protein
VEEEVVKKNQKRRVKNYKCEKKEEKATDKREEDIEVRERRKYNTEKGAVKEGGRGGL